MGTKSVLQLRKCISRIFILLIIVNQIIVINLVWHKVEDYVARERLSELTVSSSEQTKSANSNSETTKNSLVTSTNLPLTTSTNLSSITSANLPVPAPRYTMIFDGKPKNSNKFYVLFGNVCLNLFSWSLGKEMLAEDDLKLASCPHTNCVFTHKRDFLENVHDFDAILFNVWCSNLDLPLTRTPRQHYILTANE